MPPSSANPSAPTPKPWLKISLILLILASIALAAVWLWHKVSSPSEGKIRPSPATETSRAEPAATYKTLDGKYIHFKYLSTYQLRPPLKTDPGSLEQYFLVILEPFSKHLAVAVEKLPGGDLSNNGAFKLRQTYPDKYKITALPVATLTGQLATSPAGEVVAFVTHGDLLATLALTSAGGVDNLPAETKTILESFSWK